MKAETYLFNQNRTFQNKIKVGSTIKQKEKEHKESWSTVNKQNKKKVEPLINIKNESNVIKERRKAQTDLEFLGLTLMIIVNRTVSDRDAINGCWSKQFPPIHGRLAQLRKCLQEAKNPEWMTEGNNCPDIERS